MSNKDLKKMSRAELVEMIISLRKKMDTLKMENAFLNEKLADEILSNSEQLKKLEETARQLSAMIKNEQ